MEKYVNKGFKEENITLYEYGMKLDTPKYILDIHSLCLPMRMLLMDLSRNLVLYIYNIQTKHYKGK